MMAKTKRALVFTCALMLQAYPGFSNNAVAEEISPYMGGPVTLTKAPNGAIANKKLLDGIEKVAWLKPTIDQPAEGIPHKAVVIPAALQTHQ